jgi:hypothetical protein
MGEIRIHVDGFYFAIVKVPLEIRVKVYDIAADGKSKFLRNHEFYVEMRTAVSDSVLIEC